MITQAQYASYHVNTNDITSTLYDITPRYDIHIHCIHVITPTIPVVATTVVELLLNSLLIRARLHYVWYQTTLYMTSYVFYVISQPHLLTSKDCIHDITSTIFLNTDPLYKTWHTLHLWHHRHCNYEKTHAMFLTWNSVYMRSHLLNEWQHNDCIWHDTQCISVIKPTWLMTSHPMYVWNHTHCMHDTIGTLHDITSTYIFYMMSPILCVWLTQLYIWLETR